MTESKQDKQLSSSHINKIGSSPLPIFPLQVLDSLATQLAVINLSGNILYINKAWEDFARHNDGDFESIGPGVNYLEICERACHYDPSPEAKAALNGLKKIILGELGYFEMEYPCHSPELERWFLMRCSQMEGSPDHLVISHEDITKQKCLERFYQQSREEYLRVVNTIQDAVVIADHSGKILFVNRAFTKLYQYEIKEALGMDAVKLIHPNHLSTLHRFFKDLLTDGSFIGQTLDVRKDGTSFFADVRGARINFHGEECFLAVIRDISKRKEAQKALKDSEQLYHALFEKNSSMILLIDPGSGRIVNANPAACNFYGYSRQQFTKMKIYDINNLKAEEVSQAVESIKSGERNYFQFQHCLADGEIRDVEIFSGPIKIGGNLLICSIVNDISVRRRVEKEKEVLIEELQHALKEIKTLRGILPICAHCKKIRDDTGYWNQIESYINQHSDVRFSHGICPDCIEKLYPDIASELLRKIDKNK